MELNIILENSDRSFYSGDIIRGKVFFAFNNPNFIILNGSISIQFRGQVEWEWKERKFNDNSSRTIKKNHVYFEDSYRFGGSDSDADKSFQIAPHYSQSEPLDESAYYQEEGKYVFPFEYCLPEGLPSSLNSKYGSISYTIGATFRQLMKSKIRKTEAKEDRTWINCKSTSCTFSVNSTLDLNQLAYLQAEQPMQTKDSRNVCSFFHCKLSPVFATLKIPKCGYALGEDVHFVVEIRNLSSRSVENIQIGIVQEVTCSALIESVTYNHIYRRKAIDMCHKDIFKGDYDHWEDKFTIPIVPPSWNDAEKIIKIRYFIKLSMKIFTIPIQTLELTLPIVIGTIPIRTGATLATHSKSKTECIENYNYENYVDEDEFGENSEVMEAFQIDEERDSTQYSTLESVHLPLRTISGDVFEADNKYLRADENIFS